MASVAARENDPVEPAAAAVEPATDASGHSAEAACLNCGTQLVGRCCHQCGQHAHVHRTLAAFGHDLLHGVLHLEGAVWRTLPKLLFRPGELTRRYIAGERARFVSPLAMFLFSVFMMFAVMSFLGSPPNLFDEDERKKVEVEIYTELVQLRQQRSRAIADGASTASIDEDIKAQERVLATVNGFEDERTQTTPTSGTSSGYERGHRTGTQARLELGEGKFEALYQTAKQNPKLLIYKLQTNAYKFSWLLILISVPFVMLLFLWRWRPLYDHTVFVTYSITAVSILAIVGSLLALAGVLPGFLLAAVSLFIPWHMYRQLRGGYDLRRFSALWRTVALLIFSTLALGLFAFGLLMLGVLG